MYTKCIFNVKLNIYIRAYRKTFTNHGNRECKYKSICSVYRDYKKQFSLIDAIKTYYNLSQTKLEIDFLAFFIIRLS